MAYRSGKDEGEEWWRRRLGRLVAGDDEAVVRALLSARAHRQTSGLAAQWRAWTVVKDWRRNHGPQVIVKAAGRRKSASGVKACIRYIARMRLQDSLSVPVYDEFGQIVDPMTACSAWDLLSDQDNLSRKARERSDDLPALPLAQRLYHVQAHHFVISAGLAVEDTAMAAAFHHALHAGIDQLFASRGYQALWAVHEDAKHRHAHVVVKAVSRFGERLRLDIHGEAFDAMRQAFAEALTATGMPAQAVRREDRADLRASIMAGQAFLRWPKRPGNGDLTERAPAWFRRHGHQIVKRQQSASTISPQKSWWRKLLKPKVARPVALERIACPDSIPAFSDLFHDPGAALQCLRELAAGEVGRHNLALARWYLLRQPGVFGALKPHAPAQRNLALRQVGRLPALPPMTVSAPQIPGNWDDFYRTFRDDRRKKRQRNVVLMSLWRLAGSVLCPDNPAQAQSVLSRALSSLWARPIEAESSIPAPVLLNVSTPTVAKSGVTMPSIQAGVSVVVAPVLDAPARPHQTLPIRRTRPRSIGM